MPRPASLVLLASLLLAAFAPAQQKRPLTHADYDTWKSLQGAVLSDDGVWVAVTIAEQEGEKLLLVRETTGTREHRHAGGRSAAFTTDGRHVVFLIDPSHAEIRKRKLDKLAEQQKNEHERTGGAATPEPSERAGARRGGRRGGTAPSSPTPSNDDDEPKPALGILTLATGELRVIERVKSFRVTQEDAPPFVVYHLEKPLPKPREPATKREGGAEAPSEETGEAPARREPSTRSANAQSTSERATGSRPRRPARERATDPGTKRLQDGTELVLLDLRDGSERRFRSVLAYGLTDERPTLWWNVQSKADAKPAADSDSDSDSHADTDKDSDSDSDANTNPTPPPPTPGLYALDLATGTQRHLLAGPQQVRALTTDRACTRLAFCSNAADWSSEKPRDAVYAWDFVADRALPIVTADTAGLPAGRIPSAAFGLRFCEDGAMLLLGAETPPEPELRKQLPEDKVTLDLWHWRDPLLQPMQAKRQTQLENRAIPCVWSFADARLRALADAEQDMPAFITPDGSRVLLHDQEPYQSELSWDTSYYDVHVVNTADGRREQLVQRLRGRASVSPGGRFVIWFGDEPHYHAYELATRTTHCLSAGIESSVANELHDQPSPARGYGIAGWTTGDASVLLYDRYDLFEVVPGGTSTCVTDGYGRAQQITLRYVRTDPDPDERHIARDAPLLLDATSETTRASGYYEDRLDTVARPRRLIMLDKSFGALRTAKSGQRHVFTLSTFRECPDLWTADARFEGLTRLTDINPQQAGIAWGDAELVRWQSLDGEPLTGVLIKPEGFDPSRRYPMLVHIYERLSQGLHSYRSPAPGTSPNASLYVSNGYLFFLPDIVYEVGQPGDSALKCVVPGVHHLIAQGFVDPERIGISGHSWGGYQTAYLVTRTTLFRAAESGAPVANMTSAYGGIRWSTGMSRMFQYEQTQSRIGATLWDAPLAFIENSPLFELDRVRTPMLILHNDQDGAVPWYQGIELFTALRRLGKEAYLFNYVGEDHGLRRRANQEDWSARMLEFFDHHLKDAPAPRWMREGVPFRDREREKIDRLGPVPAEASAGGGAPGTEGAPEGNGNGNGR